jgi:hypothetical protein
LWWIFEKTEWMKMIETRVSTHVAQKLKIGRPKGGHSGVARQLGLDDEDVRRAAQVASLTPEAKETAKRVKLDKRRTTRTCPASPDFFSKKCDFCLTTGYYIFMLCVI